METIGQEAFILAGSDGMTLDSKGNIYVTGQGADNL